MTILFIRTCQECGNRQIDKEPVNPALASDAYNYRKCKRCGSEALDLGSSQDVDPKTLKRLPSLQDDYE